MFLPLIIGLAFNLDLIGHVFMSIIPEQMAGRMKGDGIQKEVDREGKKISSFKASHPTIFIFIKMQERRGKRRGKGEIKYEGFIRKRENKCLSQCFVEIWGWGRCYYECGCVYVYVSQCVCVLPRHFWECPQLQNQSALTPLIKSKLYLKISIKT